MCPPGRTFCLRGIPLGLCRGRSRVVPFAVRRPPHRPDRARATIAPRRGKCEGEAMSEPSARGAGWPADNAGPGGLGSGYPGPGGAGPVYPEPGYVGPGGDGPRGSRGLSRRTIIIVVSCLALAAVVVGAGTYALLRTQGSPRETAAAYLAAWQKNDYPAMSALIAAPPADLAARLGAMRTALGVTEARFRLGAVDDTRAAYTPTLSLDNVGDWTYRGALTLTEHDREWRVGWGAAAPHPPPKDRRRLAPAPAPPRGRAAI